MSDLNKLTEAIIGAAIEVHQLLGPGCWKRPIASVWHTSFANVALKWWKSNQFQWSTKKSIWNAVSELTCW